MNVNNPTSAFGLIAGAGLVGNDIMAMISLLGSSILVLEALVSLIIRKQIRFGDYEWWAATAALIFGTFSEYWIGQAEPPITQVGFVFRTTPQIINLILGLSFTLFLLAFLLGRQVKKNLPVPEGSFRASRRRGRKYQ